ncbi:hypothetical protein ACIGB8_24125 [Promicromonospora sukumoe]|uniref:hypothetical protein n=1 Tax=Promicromonospora sukumoe TaxID=88382 RepID=UPI0037C8ECC4
MYFMQFDVAQSVYQERLREAEQKQRRRTLRRIEEGRKARSRALRGGATQEPTDGELA